MGSLPEVTLCMCFILRILFSCIWHIMFYFVHYIFLFFLLFCVLPLKSTSWCCFKRCYMNEVYNRYCTIFSHVNQGPISCSRSCGCGGQYGLVHTQQSLRIAFYVINDTSIILIFKSVVESVVPNVHHIL